MIDTSGYVRFTRVAGVAETERGLLAELHGERLRVDLVRHDVLRVKISRGGVFDEDPTFAVCVEPMANRVDFVVERSDAEVRLITSAMVATLGLSPFRLDVHRTDGSPVVETAQDDEGHYWAYATQHDAFTVRRVCRGEDAVYGLGEKTGPHNRRGRDFTLWNTDVLDPVTTREFTDGVPAGDLRSDRTSIEFDPYYVSIPFFYHQRYPAGTMAASFVDNGYRGNFEFSHPREYRIHFSGGQYTEYIFAGPDMPDILGAYTLLTGRPGPPPLWSLGYHQCRWFKYTQDAVEQLARRHRDEAIPCDSLWLDIEYMDGYRVFSWDAKAFPDVDGLIERLAGRGFRLVTIIDPGVKHEPGYPVFDEAMELGLLCRTESGDIYLGQVWPGDTAFPDFVTERARQWWGRLTAAHVRSGIAGIWNDMNEPATGAVPPYAMRFGDGQYSHERYHNQYALLMAIGTTVGLLTAEPDRRPFVLSRAGFAGIQRYAANWMGDNLSRWDHLAMSVPMAMGLGLSGQPFVGADIGGFRGHPTAELFLRWMQYGTLTPFCRNHSEMGNVDQYAWAFGDVVRDVVRAAIQQRYRLMPYLYACFQHAVETGAPVQRPLVYDHQYDPEARDISDEFLLGPDLLVAPVLEAGMTARQVYLPAGCWYDWHTGERFAGPAYRLEPTPMDRIPIYARGGAVIPLWPDAPPSTMDHHPQTIELRVFVPDTDGSHRSVLQEDDGITLAALRGGRLRTSFELTRQHGRVTVRASVDGDGYPQFARTAFHLRIHGAAPTQVQLDGVRLVATGNRFVLPNPGTGFVLEFDAL